MKKSQSHQQGFTLIELMITISVIAMISAVIFTTLATVRGKARDSKRKADMAQLQKALELYYNTNNAYPSTGGGPLNGDPQTFRGLSASGQLNCSPACTSSGANGWIPNLSPTFLAQLPTDPLANNTGWSGYSYASNGINYKLVDAVIGPESFPAVGQPYYDPARPTTAWMVTNNRNATAAW